MSTKYQTGQDVPLDILCKRLEDLSKIVTAGPEYVSYELRMRIPAEVDHDADLILAEAARRLKDYIGRTLQGECKWTTDDWESGSLWNTGCGGGFEFTEDGPTANRFTHCPYCGGKLVVELKPVCKHLDTYEYPDGSKECMDCGEPTPPP